MFHLSLPLNERPSQSIEGATDGDGLGGGGGGGAIDGDGDGGGAIDGDGGGGGGAVGDGFTTTGVGATVACGSIDTLRIKVEEAPGISPPTQVSANVSCDVAPAANLIVCDPVNFLVVPS